MDDTRGIVAHAQHELRTVAGGRMPDRGERENSTFVLEEERTRHEIGKKRAREG